MRAIKCSCEIPTMEGSRDLSQWFQEQIFFLRRFSNRDTRPCTPAPLLRSCVNYLDGRNRIRLSPAGLAKFSRSLWRDNMTGARWLPSPRVPDRLQWRTRKARNLRLRGYCRRGLFSWFFMEINGIYARRSLDSCRRPDKALSLCLLFRLRMQKTYFT